MIDLPELSQLPLRSTVAFAARCARRVQPIYMDLQTEKPELSDRITILFRALSAAEGFAGGYTVDWAVHVRVAPESMAEVLGSMAQIDMAGDPLVVAAAGAAVAAFATAVAATRPNASEAAAAASQCYTQAAEAAEKEMGTASGFDDACRQDLQTLLAMNLGRFGDLGDPIDPRETGPLGSLWPTNFPVPWISRLGAGAGGAGEGGAGGIIGSGHIDMEIKSPRTVGASGEANLTIGPITASGEGTFTPPAPPLSLYFDLEEFSKDEIVEMISLLSDLYREVGGDALVIDNVSLLDPALLPEPMGV
jgi:hypothetical protein